MIFISQQLIKQFDPALVKFSIRLDLLWQNKAVNNFKNSPESQKMALWRSSTDLKLFQLYLILNITFTLYTMTMHLSL